MPPAPEAWPDFPRDAEGARNRRRRGAEDEEDLDASRTSQRPFTSAAGLALAVKIFLVLNLLLAVVMLGSNYLQYELAARMIARVHVPDAEVETNDARQAAIGLLQLAVYLITAILFVIWFYRVHANLEPLGARNLKYTSGWAAGCWFVPFLNLVRPVQIAQEIWRNSDPNAIKGEAATGSSALIGFWWAGWIISSVIGNIAGRMTLAVDSPESLRAATAVSMVDDVITIIAALLAVAVVASIDARQTARAEALMMDGSA
jgi:hypothetical protein